MVFYFLPVHSQTSSIPHTTDVLIIGGGTSGTMAGIQAARMGVNALIIEETPWLGGMLTAAGVSAVDGNYRLASGLWEEFRQALTDHYGGADKLKTGWVSNVLFEPHVGARLLADMAAKESNLKIAFNARLNQLTRTNTGWEAEVHSNGKYQTVKATIIIDATELGDVAKLVGIPYDVGMDSRNLTGEDIAPETGNNIIQDLTYVAILKDFGPTADVTIPKPESYDPTPFLCACEKHCEQEDSVRKLWGCDQMLNYGKLPNGYYMINWPINGNDYYVNLIEMTEQERTKALEKAKQHTLNFVYYMQTELGYKHIGIADDVYPTTDRLPFIPYHRESRRINGLIQLNVNYIARPFDQEYPLYRTGIAVGDYPVDHHHQAFPEAESLPDLHFYPVPSYNVPLGSLIPENTSNFIVAEKSISVSNIANGTTRLQPVCLLIGQASGLLAVLAIHQNKTPESVSVRQLQKELLRAGAFVMPYSDVAVSDPEFMALQRIGATGILKGEGKNIGWENHTHIYPDRRLRSFELKEGLKDWLRVQKLSFVNEFVTYEEVLLTIRTLQQQYGQGRKSDSFRRLKKRGLEVLQRHNVPKLSLNTTVTRAIFALLIDEILNPFELRAVDHYGNFID